LLRCPPARDRCPLGKTRITIRRDDLRNLPQQICPLCSKLYSGGTGMGPCGKLPLYLWKTCGILVENFAYACG
jgi:hypothetical protein